MVPMALYKHVANKDELLDGMVDVLVGEIDPPAAALDWKSAVRLRVLSARRALLRHPWARQAIESRTDRRPPSLTTWTRSSAMFLAGGFSADLTHHVMHALGSRMWGFTQELFDQPPAPPAGPAAQAAMAREFARRYPHIVAIATAAAHDEGSAVGHGCDDQFEFEFALDLLLDGFERLHEQGWSSPSARHRGQNDVTTAMPGSPADLGQRGAGVVERELPGDQPAAGPAGRRRSGRAAPDRRAPPCRGCRAPAAPGRSPAPSAPPAGPAPGGSRPTCTCRPRGRRLRTEFAQVTAAPERVERDVRAAAGQLGDRGRHVGRRRPPRARRPARGRAPARRARRRPRPPGRRRPPAICTADSPTPPQPCTATHSPGRTRPTCDDGAEGGGVAAAQRGGGGQVELLRDGDEVDVGRVEGDELGERAPVREAGLGLARADLVLAGRALRAPAAGVHERHGHPVADRPARARRRRPRRPCRPARARARAAGRRPGRGPARRASRCGRCRWPPPGRRRRPAAARERAPPAPRADHRRSRRPARARPSACPGASQARRVSTLTVAAFTARPARHVAPPGEVRRPSLGCEVRASTA